MDNTVRTAQKIKERPAKIARATRARGRSTPGSCNGLFSVGFPTGAQRCALRTSSNPTNEFHYFSFPLPSHLNLDGGRPHGHREALLLTFNLIRVAQHSHQCKHSGAANRLCLHHLKEFLFRALEFAPSHPVETLSFLWEIERSPHPRTGTYCFAINPRSVSPFTKYCMASATSRSPMMRTRMRMPVSPMSCRTLPAPASTK